MMRDGRPSSGAASMTSASCVAGSAHATPESTSQANRAMDSLRHVAPAEWKSLIAGGLGWMLDAMDVMLYSLILAYLIRQFGMSTSTAGLLNSLTLVASAIGGLLFALIAETWRAAHRGKALGLMQSAYAIGEAIAALVVAVVLPHFGWRAVFFVGVLPALLVFWIQSSVPEPALWTARTSKPQHAKLHTLLQGQTLRNGILAT